MTSSGSDPIRVGRGAPPIPMGPLRSLQPIHTVKCGEPLAIVPMLVVLGTVVPLEERMAAKVRWAERVGYTVIARDIPASFDPYNAVIRMSAGGTEDRERDYLAHLVFEPEGPA